MPLKAGPASDLCLVGSSRCPVHDELSALACATVELCAQSLSKGSQRVGGGLAAVGVSGDALLKHQFDLMSSTTLQEQIYWSSYVASLRDV